MIDNPNRLGYNSIQRRQIRHNPTQHTMETHTKGLTGKELRAALRSAARDNGAEGKWVSYARNEELIEFLRTKTVPDSIQRRLDEEEEAKARATEAEKHALEAAKAAQIQIIQDQGADIEEAVEAVNKVVKSKGMSLSFGVPKKDPLYHRTGTGKLIEWHLYADMPLIVTGPSGAGKTYPIEQECARQGRPLIRVNSNGGVLPSTFNGRWMAKAGATLFAEGLLPLAMRHGIVVLVDEFDFAPPEISATLHPAMEVAINKRPSLYIPDTHTRIDSVDGFVVFLTCNSMGDETGAYSGTAPVNGAITTRASRVKVDYPTVAEESAMLRRAGAEKLLANNLAKAMRDLRKAHIDDASLSLPPSLRQSIRVVQMATQGWGNAAAMPLWMAARCTLVEGMTNSEEKVAEEILQRYGILSDNGPTFDPDATEATDAVQEDSNS